MATIEALVVRALEVSWAQCIPMAPMKLQVSCINLGGGYANEGFNTYCA